MDAMIRARIDSDLKTQSELICKKMGISLSDYIRLSLFRLVEGDKTPNKTTLLATKEFEGEARKKLKRGSIDDVMAMFENPQT